jgi:hypothetical protein
MLIAKKWFFIAAGLTAGFVSAMAIFPPAAVRGRGPQNARQPVPEAAIPPAIRLVRPAEPGLGFGPEMEAILPGIQAEEDAEMLNLETGAWGNAPHFKYAIDDVPALVTWIRASGVNISGRVWPGGGADCITYNMTIAPVETECWYKGAAELNHSIPVPQPNRHSPRRWLVFHTGEETYAFRTDTGTLGILRLVGLSNDGQGVKIRYKLAQEKV